MKLHGQTIVLLPWWDAEGMKQWVRLTFDGSMDSRFMYKQIAKYVKTEFKKTVSKAWIKASCPVINEYRDDKGKEVRTQVTDDEAFTTMLEAYIQRMQSDEDEDESDSILPTEDSGSTELPVSTLPSKD